MKAINDDRRAGSFGLSVPTTVTQTDGYVLAWDGQNALVAIGDPALMLLNAAREDGMEEPAAGPPPPIFAKLSAEQSPSPITAAPSVFNVPNEGESPASWLARYADMATLRDAVLTTGLSGPSAAAWAAFASAMEWELSVPPPALDAAEGTPVPEEAGVA